MFRKIAIMLFVLCLGVPGFSQQRPSSSKPSGEHRDMGMMGMRGMSDQEIDRSLDTLQRSLNLNPSQVSSIRDLVRSRRDTFRTLHEQARPKVQQLMSQLNQANPDPAAVGRTVIELKAIREQARTKQADMDKQLSGILNPTQQQTVNNLRNQAETFMALRRLGLIGGPGGHGMFMSHFGRSGMGASGDEF